MQSLKLVIFDLDGTLSDTLASITKAVNDTIRKFDLNIQAYTPEVVRTFVGWGMMVLFQRAAPGTSEEKLKEMCAFYQTRVAIYAQEDKLYDGISDLLKGLHAKGVKMAIVSNKPQVSMDSCLRSLFRDDPEIQHWFCAIYGLPESDLTLAKPNPTLTLQVMAQEEVSANDVIYVGDSIVDVQTAHAAGIRCIGCAWGLGERKDLDNADIVAETTRNLLDLLLQ